MMLPFWRFALTAKGLFFTLDTGDPHSTKQTLPSLPPPPPSRSLAADEIQAAAGHLIK
jgi:hypothetical protein